MIFFLIIFFLLFAFLAVKQMELAVQILIFALPAYLIRFNIGPLPSTLLEVMIGLVFLVWFIANFSKLKANWRELFKSWRGQSQKIKIDYPFKWEIILLLIVSFVAAGVAGFSNSSLGIWKAYFFEPALLYIVALNVFTPPVILKPPASPELQRGEKAEESLKGDKPAYKGFLANARNDNNPLPKILWPLAFSALVVSLLAIYQKITGQFIYNGLWAAAATRRAVSFFGYPNAVGLYLGPLAMVFWGYFLYLARVKEKRAISYKLLVIVIVIISSLLAIYFAKSEGAMLGVAAGLLVFGALASRRSRLITLAIIVVATVGVIAYAPARHIVWEKISLQDFSGTVRRIGWRDTWKMLNHEHLLFGAGLANFQQAVKPYHQAGFFISDGTPDFWERIKIDASLRARAWQPLEIYLYPHNIFLNFWSELGLVGMLLFIWIIGKHFYVGFKLLKQTDEKAPLIKGVGGIKESRFLVLGLICAMVVIVVHGLVDVSYFKNDLAVMFWLLVAMLALIRMSGPAPQNAGRDSAGREAITLIYQEKMLR